MAGRLPASCYFFRWSVPPPPTHPTHKHTYTNFPHTLSLVALCGYLTTYLPIYLYTSTYLSIHPSIYLYRYLPTQRLPRILTPSQQGSHTHPSESPLEPQT